jgi:hypothetical protein
MLLDDPPAGTSISSDPDDDYLVALARAGGADCLVSGDADLTVLIDAKPPVVTPREFLERVHAARVSGTGRGDDVSALTSWSTDRTSVVRDDVCARPRACRREARARSVSAW